MGSRSNSGGWEKYQKMSKKQDVILSRLAWSGVHVVEGHNYIHSLSGLSSLLPCISIVSLSFLGRRCGSWSEGSDREPK